MGNMQGADLAGYRILEEIGGQAGSHIYKALAPDGKQIVAIKLFPAQMATDHKLLQELRDSLRTVAHMHHPGIPPILGSGLFNGRPYIVTPFLKAGSLSDRIWRGMLSALNVDQLIVDIADALEYAHARGVVHGDLKPADVLFDEDGKVFINNLGQASVLRKLHDDSDRSPEGGKEYRAPEIGAGASLSPSSDQYSLGILALELLTGQSATKALQSIRDHRREGLSYRAGSRWISSDLPEQVIDVLLRAAAERPEQRFASVEEMKLAFQAAIGIAPTPTVEPKPVPIERTKPRRQPKKIIPILATTIAIGLLVIVTLPALSSALKRIEAGVTSNEQMTETVPTEDIAQSSAISEPSDGNAEMTSGVENEAPQDNSPESMQLTIIAEGEGPPATASEGERPPASPTEEMPQVVPEASTPTSPPTNQPIKTPTITLAPTNTPPPPPTPIPSPTPTDIPLEKKCSDKPSHPHYCTPTPLS